MQLVCNHEGVYAKPTPRPTTNPLRRSRNPPPRAEAEGVGSEGTGPEGTGPELNDRDLLESENNCRAYFVL